LSDPFRTKNKTIADASTASASGIQSGIVMVPSNFQTNRNMIILLLTELYLAVAYVTIAKSDPERGKDRNTKNAREVYETVLQFLAQGALPQDEEAEIKDKLATLKSGLQSLGEIF